ncbi:MAG TPA: hypothetical protein VIG64_05070 [Actinomycetota bacterium]|jgi:cytochrome c-type biogenesis protein CcmH/NrfF
MEGLAGFGDWLIQRFLLYWVLPMLVLGAITAVALGAHRRREEQAAEARTRRRRAGSQRSGPT